MDEPRTWTAMTLPHGLRAVLDCDGERWDVTEAGLLAYMGMTPIHSFGRVLGEWGPLTEVFDAAE